MTPAILLFIFIVTACGTVMSWFILQQFIQTRSLNIFEEADAIGLLALSLTCWGWYILITHFPRISIGG